MTIQTAKLVISASNTNNYLTIFVAQSYIAPCQNTEHFYAELPKKSTPNYRKLK